MKLNWEFAKIFAFMPDVAMCGHYTVKCAQRTGGKGIGWYIRWHDVAPNLYITTTCTALKGGNKENSVWFDTREEAMDVAQLHHDNKDNL